MGYGNGKMYIKNLIAKYLIPNDPVIIRNLIGVKIGASIGALIGIHLLTSTHEGTMKHGIVGSVIGGTGAAYMIGFNNFGIKYIPYVKGLSVLGLGGLFIYTRFLNKHRRSKNLKIRQ